MLTKLSGSQKGGIRGEVNRGKGVREGTGLEGERGEDEGKRAGGKGPESTSKNSDFDTPMIVVLLELYRNLRSQND